MTPTPDPDSTGTASPAPDPDATSAPAGVPVGTTADLPGKPAWAGRVIAGRYKLAEELGEGGMGTVYLAKQSVPVKRFVALKVIKAGADSKAVLARFEAERQALALMDHPNIARVLDAGATDEGEPFFAMELVAGVPITVYCNAHRLSVRQRLELFVPVCKAIQHAHQKGVIHRDIKPSNVLVAEIDDRPVPKVIDFGVAKATGTPLTDSTLETGVGAVVGTPEYMSPEQASLDRVDIDTRSDVYALGVLLYELLVGSTPVDRKSLGKAALLEVLRVVREVEAPRPSAKLSTADGLPSIAASRGVEPRALCRLLRGELDWVALKALEKDRSRRYDTPTALARDVEHYLSDEVVEARPPSAGYRLRKLVRRNKGRAIAAGLVLAALVCGLAGTTWGLLRAEAAEGRAVAERDRAETAGQVAIAERDKAVVAADAERAAKEAEEKQRKEAEAANERAQQALESFTDDLTEKLIVSRPVLTEVEKAVLRNALKQWEAFAQSKGDTPAARGTRVSGLLRVAYLQNKLGQRADAEANCRAAQELCKRLVADNPTTPKYGTALATSHDMLGVMLDARSDWAGAGANYRAAIALRERLAANASPEPGHRAALAHCHNNLGNLLYKTGDWAGAETEYREALFLHERLAADNPETPEYRYDLAIHRNNLGNLLLNKAGDRAGAEAEYRVALALIQRLATASPEVVRYREVIAVVHNSLGDLMKDRSDRSGAEANYRSAVALGKQLATDAPGVPEYRTVLATSHNKLGNLLSDGGDRAGAEAAYRAALALRERLAADNSATLDCQVDLGGSYCNFGLFIRDGGNPADSTPWFDKAVHTLARVNAADSQAFMAKQFLHNSYLSRAKAHDLLEQYADAAHDWEKALELATLDKVSDIRISLGVSTSNHAYHLFKEDKLAESLEWYDKAVGISAEVVRRSPANNTARLVFRNSHWGRALVHDQLARPADADRDWDNAVEFATDKDRTAIRAKRADSRLRAGRVAEAVAEVAELAKADGWGGDDWYNFACVYAVASGKVEGKRDEYAARAVELLRRAVAAGYDDRPHMLQDADLDPIRRRADYRALVAEMRARAPKVELAPAPRVGR